MSLSLGALLLKLFELLSPVAAKLNEDTVPLLQLPRPLAKPEMESSSRSFSSSFSTHLPSKCSLDC